MPSLKGNSGSGFLRRPHLCQSNSSDLNTIQVYIRTDIDTFRFFLVFDFQGMAPKRAAGKDGTPATGPPRLRDRRSASPLAGPSSRSQRQRTPIPGPASRQATPQPPSRAVTPQRLMVPGSTASRSPGLATAPSTQRQRTPISGPASRQTTPQPPSRAVTPQRLTVPGSTAPRSPGLTTGPSTQRHALATSVGYRSPIPATTAGLAPVPRPVQAPQPARLTPGPAPHATGPGAPGNPGMYNMNILDRIAQSQGHATWQAQPPPPPPQQQSYQLPPYTGPLDIFRIATDRVPRPGWTTWHLQAHRANLEDGKLVDPEMNPMSMDPDSAVWTRNFRMRAHHRGWAFTASQERWAYWYNSGGRWRLPASGGSAGPPGGPW